MTARSFIEFRDVRREIPRPCARASPQRVRGIPELCALPHMSVRENVAFPLYLREQLQIEIKQIQRHLGVTVIYVTHDQCDGAAATFNEDSPVETSN